MFEGIQNRLQKEITDMAGSVVKVGWGVRVGEAGVVVKEGPGLRDSILER